MTNKYELTITAEIRDARNGYGRGLEIRDSVTLTAASFLELAQVLGRFHELAQQLGGQPAYPTAEDLDRIHHAEAAESV